MSRIILDSSTMIVIVVGKNLPWHYVVHKELLEKHSRYFRDLFKTDTSGGKGKTKESKLAAVPIGEAATPKIYRLPDIDRDELAPFINWL